MTAPTSRPSAPSAETKAKFRLLAATDLYGFARHLLYRHLAEKNQLTPAFHRPLCQAVQTTPFDENLYLLFRGSFKTSLLTVARILQRILAAPGSPAFGGRPCGPNTRILLASSTSDNAEQMLLEIQAHLKNPYLLWAFSDILGTNPEQLPEHTKGGLTVRRPNRALRGSTIRAVGISSELTSQHYDHGVFDDIVAKNNSGTRELRETVVDFERKARPLFDPGSTRDYIGTTWHYDDALSRKKAAIAQGAPIGLYERRAWEPCAPGDPLGADVPGYGWVRPTFPERFTMAWLLRERQEPPVGSGAADFSAQYLLNPISGETAHFQRDGLRIEAAAPPFDDLWIGMTIDPAISMEKRTDWTACAVGGFDVSGDLWLLELLRLKRDEHGLIRTVYDLAARFPRLMAIGVETTGFQKIYRSLFEAEGRRRGWFLPITKLERDTRGPRGTKNARIGGLKGYWDARQIHALRSCQALGDFQDEADKWRPDQEAAHDDLLDAVVDLYQIRGVRTAPAPTPAFGDPEVAERADFEAAILRRAPWMDRMSLRTAWVQQRGRAEQARMREEAALGAGEEAAWG